MSRTPAELIEWIEEINEHRREQLEALKAGRKR